MAIHKVQCMGDVMYFDAPSRADAETQLEGICGPIPKAMLNWQEVAVLPEGEELAPDFRK